MFVSIIILVTFIYSALFQHSLLTAVYKTFLKIGKSYFFSFTTKAAVVIDVGAATLKHLSSIDDLWAESTVYFPIGGHANT